MTSEKPIDPRTPDEAPAVASAATSAPRSRRRATTITVVAAVAVATTAALVLALGPLAPRPNAPAPTAPPTATPAPTSPETAYQRPADWSPYRPAVHLTPAERWMNDPQRPFWLDGRWHYYYLFNADYPEGNGTEWYHATSTDLVHWRDEGVAIDKYENGLGDIETGSAVIDVENTAGFGAGAVIAVVTQQHEGVQRQSLFVSTDGGFRFEPIDGNPVLDNPGVRDFRDPKIVWDEARRTWIMVLAEGSKLGFYTSSDLRDWTYRSGFDRDDLGLLETPDLFRISVDGDPANTRWVLMAGAHGDLDRDGMSTGTAYWTGDWNGERFTADRDEPAWLDRGADLYATVTWDDSRLAPAERLERRYAIGWLNNWAYAGDLPTEDWQGGAASVVREISLRTIDGVPTLTSAPIETLAELEGAPARATDVVVREAPDVSAAGTRAETVSALPQPTSDAYRLRVELAATEAERGEARIRVKEGGGHFATVGVDFATNRVFIARDADTAASAMPSVYREVRWANVAPRDGVVTLDVIVDAASVEVFANDGEAVLSSVMFPSPGANGLSAEAVGGDIRFRSFEISPLAVAPVERLD